MTSKGVIESNPKWHSTLLNHLGCDNIGKDKPRVCWNYVNKGTCDHLKELYLDEGQILDNLWHPAKEEKEYLKINNKYK